VLVGSEAEVLDSLSGVLWTSQQQRVASSWGSQRQLIESQDFSSSSQDAGTCSCSESQSSNAELRNSQETVVICDGTNDDDCLVVRLLGSVGDNSRNRDRGSVDARHEEATEDDLVEGRLGSA